MSIENGYCSNDLNSEANLAALKARTTLAADDAEDDEILSSVIEAVSRMFDEELESRFYAESMTLYFEAINGGYLSIPELISLTTLKTDDNDDATFENTWSASDYELLPVNAQAATIKYPYTEIEIKSNGTYSFPVGIRKGVEIAGSWGRADGSTIVVPRQIVEACLLQSLRLYKRKDAVFGTESATDFGTIKLQMPKLDGDVMRLIHPFKKDMAF